MTAETIILNSVINDLDIVKQLKINIKKLTNKNIKLKTKNKALKKFIYNYKHYDLVPVKKEVIPNIIDLTSIGHDDTSSVNPIQIVYSSEDEYYYSDKNHDIEDAIEQHNLNLSIDIPSLKDCPPPPPGPREYNIQSSFDSLINQTNTTEEEELESADEEVAVLPVKKTNKVVIPKPEEEEEESAEEEEEEESAEEEEEEESAEEEEEEEEVMEVVIDRKSYFTDDTTNGTIYENVNDEVGKEVGKYIKGKPLMFNTW